MILPSFPLKKKKTFVEKTEAWAAPRYVYTTRSWAAPGRVYNTEAFSAPGRVYTTVNLNVRCISIGGIPACSSYYGLIRYDAYAGTPQCAIFQYKFWKMLKVDPGAHYSEI